MLKLLIGEEMLSAHAQKHSLGFGCIRAQTVRAELWCSCSGKSFCLLHRQIQLPVQLHKGAPLVAQMNQAHLPWAWGSGQGSRHESAITSQWPLCCPETGGRVSWTLCHWNFRTGNSAHTAFITACRHLCSYKKCSRTEQKTGQELRSRHISCN